MCRHDDWEAFECCSRFYLSFSPSQLSNEYTDSEMLSELSKWKASPDINFVEFPNCFSLAMFWMSTQRSRIQMKIQIRQFGLYANEKVRNQNWKLNFVVFHLLSALFVAILLLMSFILTRFFHPDSSCALVWVNLHTPHTCRYLNSDISQAEPSHRNEIRSVAEIRCDSCADLIFPSRILSFRAACRGKVRIIEFANSDESDEIEWKIFNSIPYVLSVRQVGHIYWWRSNKRCSNFDD